MEEDSNRNGKKYLVAWIAVLLTASINVIAAVGYVVAVRVELSGIAKQLDKIENRLLYLERKDP